MIKKIVDRLYGIDSQLKTGEKGILISAQHALWAKS